MNILKYTKGYRTVIVAWLLLLEPLLEATLVNDMPVDAEKLVRQAVIALVIVVMRHYTTTPMGMREPPP